MNKVVNQDFVSIIMQNGSSLVYSERPIDYDILLVQRLEDCIADDTMTLLDVMEIVSCHRRYKDSTKEYQYASTKVYNATYVSPAIMPKIVSSSEYKSLLYRQMNYKIRDHEERRKIAERIIKERYVKAVIRYLYAEAYYNTIDDIFIDKILGNSEIRLYSTEKIGWDSNTFKVTNDIEIIVKTNFCYGEAAYMNFSFRYKGILITPYSDYVSYFYARMYSIINCTRDYCPQRDNWKRMFEFIIELSELATNNIDEFINRWLVREINNMIEGLKDMYDNTSKYISRISALNNNVIDSSHIRIFLISGISQRNIMVNDDELELSFLGEKISGALRFIDNLKQVEQIHIDDTKAIDTILCLNKKLKPRLEKGIKNVEKDIERIEPIEQEKRKIFDELVSEVDIYVEGLRKSKAYLKRIPEHDAHKKYSDSEQENILREFLLFDEFYNEMERKKILARGEWTKYEVLLKRRNNFKLELISYINDIELFCGK